MNPPDSLPPESIMDKFYEFYQPEKKNDEVHGALLEGVQWLWRTLLEMGPGFDEEVARKEYLENAYAEDPEHPSSEWSRALYMTRWQHAHDQAHYAAKLSAAESEIKYLEEIEQNHGKLAKQASDLRQENERLKTELQDAGDQVREWYNANKPLCDYVAENKILRQKVTELEGKLEESSPLFTSRVLVPKLQAEIESLKAENKILREALERDYSRRDLFVDRGGDCLIFEAGRVMEFSHIFQKIKNGGVYSLSFAADEALKEADEIAALRKTGIEKGEKE